ncbi:tRNA (adenosine(37)-N6)-threonylcarbamoyltransferase complex dimerization subunit type 1 TsaB [Bradyrhizobium sp. LHD-71]|uniref:tRNA (adenosine(37)-N6)-threonylcarbamoyltransferase complex dimerization subunit type 1 TsaB n=1 Tax=Bradyrhizobium sp. LHD-71 TaxID=3072141 RepID=UPI00280EDA8F|nr:tRNA (adenosine(37)-N6)-threonylcarbamoyltransferase complex dimerization subunit type 1 TsaB [Bradyrhizobium sp. LHD-71]MDQ8730143.1 tRNA (adenosine(37)-N6)-threonylcarbamoyltransferase complex dimerization subunit type 1 TsaB [Bradyrhizobium sp. LHD-71]
MLILAIDTALEACAVAVLDSEANSLRAHESQAMARGHAEALMPMVDRVMKAAALPFTALDRIAVTVGPGSFTGLRVGISAARGLGLAADKPVVGVTTLSAFAAPHLAEAGGPIVSLIDARHDHVYMQVVDGDGTALVRPCIAPIADVFDQTRFGPLRLVGNAAQLVAERWPGHVTPPASVEQSVAPEIVWVAWVGVAANPATSKPRPLYLRAVDAKPQAIAVQDRAALSASS